MTEGLLEKLAQDSQERLKWLVCRRLGILPGSWRWRFMTARQVLRLACHMALDARERDFPGHESGAAAGFDTDRFRELGGGL